MTMISATTTNTRCHSIHQQLDESTVAVAAATNSSSSRGGRLLQSLFGLSNPQRPLSPSSKEQPQQHGHQDTFCLLDLFNPLRGSEPLSLEQQASLAESLLLLKGGECSSSSSKQPQPPHHRRDESTLFTEEEEEEDGYDDDEMDAWNFRYIDPQSPSSQPLQERRVSFQKVVCVVEVPSHRDFPPDLREQLWYSADEMDAVVERNTMEYLVEGRDWRRASEEYVFSCHPLTGELLHPATWMKTVFMKSTTLPHDGESSWPYQERRRRRYKRRTNTRRQRRQRQLLVSSSVWIDNNLFATNVPFYPPPPPKLSAEYHLVQHQHQLQPPQLPSSPSNSSISTKMMDNTGNCPAVLLPLSSRQRCCLENAAASSSGNNYYPTTTSSSYYHDRTY